MKQRRAAGRAQPAHHHVEIRHGQPSYDLTVSRDGTWLACRHPP
jgi:hypothetical protein